MLHSPFVNISDFHYEFPSELIAVKPSAQPAASRLLIYGRESKSISHKTFADLPDLLKSGDLLVVNSSQVLPARFYGQRKSGAKLEGLYIERRNSAVKVWLKGKAEAGEVIEVYGFGDLKVLDRSEKSALLEVDPASFVDFLRAHGEVPVPPYIKAEREKRSLELLALSDAENYQTYFAKNSKEAANNFSAAAPTASLHFDAELISRLKQKGCEFAEVKLHVGEATFAPVTENDLDKVEMHLEEVEIRPEQFEKILKAKKEKRRIIAVGTTALRALETAVRRFKGGERVDQFATKLFIRPPFKFEMADALLTNFHWPDSTLIVLAATFMEAVRSECDKSLRHDWREVYAEAIQNQYRLFSYGDGMLIV